MRKKIDMQYSEKEGYDFRFADNLQDIDKQPTKVCPTLYDLLREVIANSGLNNNAKRFAVQQLVDFYLKD